MDKFVVLEPAIDPNNRIAFLLDWELTMKCNLDCSYCGTGLYGSHDNSTAHPPLSECLESVDFMLDYVDIYMRHKPQGIRHVILNVYGGEALHHPNIVEILEYVQEKYRAYQDQWNLTITTTTNLIINDRILNQITPLIDEFTVSYHTESTIKQREQFKQNVLYLKEHNKRTKCIIVMHNRVDLWNDAEDMVKWCEEHEIKYLAKQIDDVGEKKRFDYNQQQIHWFEKTYQSRSWKTDINLNDVKQNEHGYELSAAGRSCCGGRQLCLDRDYKTRYSFTSNYFPDWYCSVNEFFVFVKQLTREIFVNKDCKMAFDGKIGPIGHLDRYKELLGWTEENLKQKSMPVIQCKKKRCFCGLCAPKAQDLETFNKIMEKYQR